VSSDKHQIGALLSRIALHDHQAFEALYLLAGPRLYTLLHAIVKDEQIAADLLQEGFLKLWFNGQTYPPDYPWAWLCQSMRNLAIDEMRKKTRHKAIFAHQQDDPWKLDELTTSGTGETDHKEPDYSHLHHQALNHCLQNLQPEKRNVIVLAYQHGMSHQEIVAHSKTPIGTVKSWIRRGLQELKRCLTE
jgi:RNA polymerase sigma-70 factor (ECF subfamily)